MPVFRSKVFRAVGAPFGEAVEQAHSVPDRSSAKTPNTRCRPFVPGLTHTSAVAAPFGARNISSFVVLPMIRAPSSVDVRLSDAGLSSLIVTSFGADCAKQVEAASKAIMQSL